MSKNYGNDLRQSYPLPYEDFFEDLDPDCAGMLEIIRDDQELWAPLL